MGAVRAVAVMVMLSTVLLIALYSKNSLANEPILPIPNVLEVDAKKAALGKRLFHEARLSGNNTISCATCHPLSNAGMDNSKVSAGIEGRLGSINTPTVFNSGFNYSQFWDGRAKTLQEQVDGPINNPNEMGSDWQSVVNKLTNDSEYPRLFKALFSDGITPANIKDAIAEFELSLITPNSRFDRYLRGESTVLTQQEQDGYRLFKSYGCTSCHQGVNIGGNMYEKMGVFGDYFAVRGKITDVDYGRYNITAIEEQRHEFKVPSLRNVALTAPYFHDGNAPTLEEAVKLMSQYQLGRIMPDEDVAKIVAFLYTLTGDFGEYAHD